jgi:RNA polymerase sigma factor (sigma-70 family)
VLPSQRAPESSAARVVVPAPRAPDASTVAAAAAGDRSAQHRLYVDHVDVLTRFARGRCRNVQEAEDLVHDTFARAFAALPRWTDQGYPFSSYLFAILRNLLAAPSRFRPEPADETALVDVRSPEDVEADVLRALDAEDLHAVLDRLPDRFRLLLELRFLEQREPAEIAELLDMKAGTVRVIVHRALAAARREYAGTPSLPEAR